MDRSQIPDELVNEASKRKDWKMTEEVQVFLDKILLQRLKSSIAKYDGLNNIKPLETIDILTELESPELEQYNQMETEVRKSFSQKARSGSGQQKYISPLLNACYKNDMDSSKNRKTVGLLKNIFQENTTEKVIIAYSIKASAVSNLMAMLTTSKWKFASIKTNMTKKSCKGEIEKFKTDQGCRILLAPQSTMMGHNITEASRVIFLNPSVVPHLEKQVIGRAARIGQLKPVHSYRVIAVGTVDERIVKVRKREESTDQNNFNSSKLSSEDEHFIVMGCSRAPRRNLRSSVRSRQG
jgi:SNF2 family DNA or RNA helicase